MNPRYQIFISSTSRDLVDERQAAIEAVLEHGHFPAFMEVFPAADSTPWQLIEKIIEESDYFILIIAGRYGSTDEKGISYTEREYDLAQRLGIPILVFLHGNPDLIQAGKVEMAIKAQKKLAQFRRKIEKHHWKPWLTPSDLKTAIVVGLNHQMRVTPRDGWVRASERDSPETLKKLTTLLEDNALLTRENQAFKDSGLSVMESILAGGDEATTIDFRGSHGVKSSVSLTWNELFRALSPHLIEGLTRADLTVKIIAFLRAYPGAQHNISLPSAAAIADKDVQKIIIQFVGLEHWEPTGIHSTHREVNYGLNTERVSTDMVAIQLPGFRLTRQGIRRLATLIGVPKRKTDLIVDSNPHH